MSTSFDGLNFVDDFLGGGLCGGPLRVATAGLLGCLGVLIAGLVAAVNDAGSLGVVFLCGFSSACSTVALCGLVVVAGGENTGNLVCDVLGCLKRPSLVECTMPGEYEDSEVGVEPRLHMPGDSEYLVEGVLAEGMRGVVEGSRGSVGTAVRRLANSTGPCVVGVSIT
jgi:hypothetical protein